MCHTASYYYFGKDPTFAFGTAVPFGLNSRLQNAWILHGGGIDLMNDFYKKFNIYGIPCGNTGCQMGGWFRKEIKTAADLNGLKMRIGGFAGQVMAKLGVVPQQIAGGDIYPALEKGTIDAGRMGRPLRRREARLPEGRAVLLLSGLVGRRRDAAQLHQHREVECAAEDLQVDRADRVARCANTWMQSKYDAAQSGGAEASGRRRRAAAAVPAEVLDACFKAANEVYAETSAKNADFKKVYDNMVAFRNDEYLWWQVAEYTFDTFMIRARATRT